MQNELGFEATEWGFDVAELSWEGNGIAYR